MSFSTFALIKVLPNIVVPYLFVKTSKYPDTKYEFVAALLESSVQIILSHKTAAIPSAASSLILLFCILNVVIVVVLRCPVDISAEVSLY